MFLNIFTTIEVYNELCDWLRLLKVIKLCADCISVKQDRFMIGFSLLLMCQHPNMTTQID